MLVYPRVSPDHISSSPSASLAMLLGPKEPRSPRVSPLAATDISIPWARLPAGKTMGDSRNPTIDTWKTQENRWISWKHIGKYWKIIHWFPFMNDFPRKNYSYPFIDGTFPQLTVNWGSSKLWLFHVKHFLVFLGEAWFTSYVVLVCTDTIIPGVLSQQIIITITIIIIIELEDAAIRGTELSDLPWF